MAPTSPPAFPHPAVGQLARASPSRTGSRRVGAAPLAGFTWPTGASGVAPSVRTGRGLFGGPGLSVGVWGGFAAMSAEV